MPRLWRSDKRADPACLFSTCGSTTPQATWSTPLAGRETLAESEVRTLTFVTISANTQYSFILPKKVDIGQKFGHRLFFQQTVVKRFLREAIAACGKLKSRWLRESQVQFVIGESHCARS